jgi:preprotein translocase subunit SecG
MQTILVVVHLFVAVGLVGLVLIQHGKGADAGAAFGSGASGTVFGARGSGSFLTRATAILAVVFFLTSLTLAWYAMQTTDRPGLMEQAADSESEVVEEVLPAPASEVPEVINEEQQGSGSDEEVPTIPE